MGEPKYFIALDQGTTSSRSILYSVDGVQRAVASAPLTNRYPQSGWVEQDPEEIWSTQLQSLQAVTQGIDPSEIICLGLTNQRETTVAWDRVSGLPLAPAIVWQCRRSAEICTRLRESGHEPMIKDRTGLVLDPYFSATKIQWLLEHNPTVQAAHREGRAVFGTVDSWLLYRLSAGKLVVTEPSNASRTMLCNLATGDWDEELLSLFSLRREMLPEIRSSAGSFGTTAVLGGEIPITGVLGDQQAALLGHGCLTAGRGKCTFGTGAFMLVHSGDQPIRSNAGLLTTIAWSVGGNIEYALEGSVFIAGALIQWLRDNLKIIAASTESEELARSVASSNGVIVVPAFVGLGAPHWNDGVRGAMFGLTRDTSPGHIARASLEAVAHQIADLLEGPEFAQGTTLGIDGGMIVNELFCQILADTTGLLIEVPPTPEITALGAVRIAAHGAGRYASLLDVCGVLTGVEDQATVRSYRPSDLASSGRLDRKRWKQAIRNLI